MKQKGAKIYSALINFLRICIIVLLVVKVVMNDFQFIHYLLTTFLFTFYDKILQTVFTRYKKIFLQTR